MRRTICLSVLLLGAAGSAAAQRDTIPARRDTTAADSAAADSAALVRELEGMSAAAPDTTPQEQPAGAGAPQRLRPAISVVGAFIGDLSPEGSTQEGGRRVGVREVESAAQAAVDPYFRGDVFLGISDAEGISISSTRSATSC